MFSLRNKIISELSLKKLPYRELCTGMDIWMTCDLTSCLTDDWLVTSVVVVVTLLFYIHGKHLRSCQDGQLT